MSDAPELCICIAIVATSRQTSHTMAASVSVPLVHKSKPIGALNLLSRERDRYTERDATILRQFAAHVSTALVNARLFERQRLDAEAFETLAEIGREVAAVLDLDELLSRVAQLTRRVIDYRTFGILLLNEKTRELEIEVAVQYGEKVTLPKVPLGEGIVGYAALHREAVMSMSTGFRSRAAAARPSSSDAYQPSLSCAWTLASTEAGSTQRFANSS